MKDWLNRCHFGDVRDVLRRMAADGVQVQTCITSPPYFGLRSYLPAEHPDKALEIGAEETPEAFIDGLVDVFRAVREVLADDGTLWVNIGDSYNAYNGNRGSSESLDRARDGAAGVRPILSTGAGLTVKSLKNKDLIGIPWMLAFALRADGWYLRQDIIWAKPNPMPESVTDRCTKSHEYVFLLSKNSRYYFDHGSIREPAVGQNEHDLTGRTKQRGMRDTFQRADSKRAEAIPGQTVGTHRPDRAPSEWDTATRNKRNVWTVATTPYGGAHFATFPTALIEPCVLAGAPAGGVVLDPFFGSGTTGQVAQALGRNFIGIEINQTNEPLQAERLRQPSLMLG